MKHLPFHRSYIICFFFALISINAYSQCDTSNQVTPAYDCTLVMPSSYICDFNGLCCIMEPGSWGAEADFCAGSSLQNPHWYSFVSNGEPIDIEISVTSCVGVGIQWALYDQCNSLNNALVCNGGAVPEGGNVSIIYSNTVAGKTYYVVVDGFSGATCQINFVEFSGISPIEVQSGDNTELTGNTNICPTNTSNFSFAGFPFANIYEWSLNGNPLAITITPEIVFTVPALSEGSHELCVTGTNICDSVGLELCWDLTVTSDQTISLHEVICPGDSFLFQGVNYAAGNFSINYDGINSCFDSVELSIEEFDIPEDTIYTIIICNELNTFEHYGTIYELDTLYENIPFINLEGCNYKGKLLIHRLDTSLYKITSDLNELPCNSPFYASLKLTGPVLPDAASVKVTWYNQEGQELGKGPWLDVNQPGNYYLIVIQEYHFGWPFYDSENFVCINRVEYTINNLSEIVTDPVLAPGLQTPATGDYEVKITNPENYPTGTEYIWIVPEGVLYSEITDGISLYLPVEGTYNICVYAQDDCSSSDTTCFDVIVDETLGSNAILKNLSLKLRQNPVGDHLIIDLHSVNKEQFKITVLDINGSILKDETAMQEGSAIKVAVQSLQSGVYIYMVTNDGGLRTVGKFVKI